MRLAFRALILFLFFGYVVARGAQRGNDFKYPYVAAQAFWRTSQLHLMAQPRYPVSFHVLLSPLASLPIGLAATVWAAVSFAAVGALPKILHRLTGLTPRQQLLPWIVVSPFMIDALVLGQSDPINLFLVTSALLAARDGRRARGVGLIGLAGMIKILPLVHWATIVSRTRSKSVWAGMLLTFGFALGLIVAAVGWEPAWTGLAQQWSWIANYEKPWHLVARRSDLRVNNESLAIVLARTFGDLGRGRPKDSLSLGLFPLETIWAAWGVILAMMAMAWIACAWALRRQDPARAWLGMFALTSIIMLVSSPICWHHYFLWLLPAALYLAPRTRLLWAAAGISALGTAWPTARGAGCHAWLALGFFGLIASDLLMWARLTEAESDRRSVLRPGPLWLAIGSVGDRVPSTVRTRRWRGDRLPGCWGKPSIVRASGQTGR